MSFTNMKTGLKKISKISYVFYIFAILIFIIFIMSCYSVTVYIQSLITAGTLVLSSQWVDVVMYYVNNTLNFLVYIFLLIGVGYLITYVKNQQTLTLDDIFGDDLDMREDDSFEPEEEIEIIAEDLK